MSQRMLRVNELLKRELGNYISKEFDFLNVLVSVHSVEVAPNLQSAKVHVGVIGDGSAIHRVIEKLNHNRVAMQSYLSKRVTMRYTPRLKFFSDDSVERGVRVVSLLDSLEKESQPADVDTADGVAED
ncbi:MAG: 30S ribosome-binding factor RbfA [Verrucomicrobiales bacterium]|nr:30S ribosome-binding factor RbfA [Verrucomicrobiales bacterium]